MLNRFEIWNKEIYEKRADDTKEFFIPEELANAYGDKAPLLIAQIRKSYHEVLGEENTGKSSIRKNLFLCHSSKDKAFVRRLAEDLTRRGVTVWFDEWEMLPGDSLYDKIQGGISDSSWFAVVLSPNSVGSAWVKRELNNAFEEELRRKKIFVIPILYEDCEIPGFLKEKVYVNMTGENYEKEFDYLLRRFDI